MIENINAIDWPLCVSCGKPAACLGAYEGAEVQEYACNVCCGHGCEDGYCSMLEGPPEPAYADA